MILTNLRAPTVALSQPFQLETRFNDILIDKSDDLSPLLKPTLPSTTSSFSVNSASLSPANPHALATLEIAFTLNQELFPEIPLVLDFAPSFEPNLVSIPNQNIVCASAQVSIKFCELIANDLQVNRRPSLRVFFTESIPQGSDFTLKIHNIQNPPETSFVSVSVFGSNKVRKELTITYSDIKLVRPILSRFSSPYAGSVSSHLFCFEMPYAASEIADVSLNIKYSRQFSLSKLTSSSCQSRVFTGPSAAILPALKESQYKSTLSLISPLNTHCAVDQDTNSITLALNSVSSRILSQATTLNKTISSSVFSSIAEASDPGFTIPESDQYSFQANDPDYQVSSSWINNDSLCVHLMDVALPFEAVLIDSVRVQFINTAANSVTFQTPLHDPVFSLQPLVPQIVLTTSSNILKIYRNRLSEVLEISVDLDAQNPIFSDFELTPEPQPGLAFLPAKLVFSVNDSLTQSLRVVASDSAPLRIVTVPFSVSQSDMSIALPPPLILSVRSPSSKPSKVSLLKADFSVLPDGFSAPIYLQIDAPLTDDIQFEMASHFPGAGR